MDPSKAPGKFTLRDLGGMGGGGAGRGGGTAAAEAGPTAPGSSTNTGEARFEYNLWLRQRGDANIKTLTDLYTKANFFNDPQFTPLKNSLMNNDKPRALDMAVRMQQRFMVQEILLEAYAEMNLDAVIYPTSNIPPQKVGAPAEPTVNGRNGLLWSGPGLTQGFPVITVPVGYTTEVYDRIRDPKAPPPAPGWTRGGFGGAAGERDQEPTVLVGPTPAVLPVGMDISGRPFSEPTLIAIAGAYQDYTHHRHPPPDFGPLTHAN